MLPPIGSVSVLPGHGRAGVVVAARSLGEPEGGRQLVAVKIKAETTDGDAAKTGQHATGDRSQAPSSTGPAIASSDKSRTSAASATPVAAKLPDQLNPGERADLAKLQQRDQQVRQEEKAHAAVAGDLAGPISYVFQRGPDGKQYAVGGSVSIRATTVSGDPEEAKRLSSRMAAAAHAATNPSAQDLATARQAYDFGNRLATQTSGTGDTPEFSLTL